MDEHSSTGAASGAPPRVPPDATAEAARHIALRRQREELRRERDQLLLDLAKGLGRPQMAELLGIEPRELGRLVGGARRRLQGAALEFEPAGGGEIRVRRLRSRDEAHPAPLDRPAPEPRPGRAQSGPAQRTSAPAPTGRGGRWAEVDALYEAIGLRALAES